MEGAPQAFPFLVRTAIAGLPPRKKKELKYELINPTQTYLCTDNEIYEQLLHAPSIRASHAGVGLHWALAGPERFWGYPGTGRGLCRRQHGRGSKCAPESYQRHPQHSPGLSNA